MNGFEFAIKIAYIALLHASAFIQCDGVCKNCTNSRLCNAVDDIRRKIYEIARENNITL